jgi:hypothetical protein
MNPRSPPLGDINADALTQFDAPPADGRIARGSGDPVPFEGFATGDFDENLVLDESGSEEEEWVFCVVQPDGTATQ